MFLPTLSQIPTLGIESEFIFVNEPENDELIGLNLIF